MSRPNGNNNDRRLDPTLEMLQEGLDGDEGLNALKALQDLVHSQILKELDELRVLNAKNFQLLKEARNDRSILMRQLGAMEGRLEHAEKQLIEAMEKLERKDVELKVSQELVQDLEVACRRKGVNVPHSH